MKTNISVTTLLQKHCNKKQETEKSIIKLCVYIYPQGAYTPQAGNEKGTGFLPFTGVRITSLLLVVLFFFLYGCRNYIVPEEGALSLESARIDFPKENVSEALWKGKHLDVKYSISKNSDEFVISGTVNIHNSVLMSFDKIEQLVVKFNFLDNSGRVLGTADITPRYSTYDKVDGPLDFKNVVSTVPGASSFAFSYFGTLFGRLNKVSETWEIFLFPFE